MLFDLVSLGAVLYTSFPLVAPPPYGLTSASAVTSSEELRVLLNYDLKLY